MKFSAVLFDRDGTVIFDRHYLSDPAGVELIPGTGEALARLGAAGIEAYLVSNQSGIGRGYFPESGWYSCQARLDELLAGFGAKLADTRFCPHAPEEDYACRKPGVGMWESLREAHGLKAASCAMVGDKPEDLRFGINAGLAAAVLVLTGKGMKSAEKLGLDVETVSRAGFLPVPAANIPAEWFAGVTAPARLFVAVDTAAAVDGLMAL
ncbi:MAG: HAD-IIIA family hydrolase [Mailhella sp.]|nr:HAD-IIIA family hydrolase [Mailhella sp.]